MLLTSLVVKGKIPFGNSLGLQARIEDLDLKCCIYGDYSRNRILGRNPQPVRKSGARGLSPHLHPLENRFVRVTQCLCWTISISEMPTQCLSDNEESGALCLDSRIRSITPSFCSSPYFLPWIFAALDSLSITRSLIHALCPFPDISPNSCSAACIRFAHR